MDPTTDVIWALLQNMAKKGSSGRDIAATLKRIRERYPTNVGTSLAMRMENEAIPGSPMGDAYGILSN